MHGILLLFLTLDYGYCKMFPAWEPDAEDVLCAKFLYFYEPKCFRGYVESLKTKLRGLSGIKRLQVACYNLAQALGGCLRFFNEKCSQDLLHTGKGSFTSAALAPASRAALMNYREAWVSEGGPNFGLDINKCTSYGGLCEHESQLYYCGGKSRLSMSLYVIFLCYISFHIIRQTHLGIER